MRRIASILLIIILCSCICPSFGLEWADESAVYIEDGGLLRVIPDNTDKKPTTDKSPTEATSNGSLEGLASQPQEPMAIPVEIVPGQCVKFNECYPIMFYPKTEGQDLVVTNYNLYEFILRLSDVCEPSDLPAERSLIENVGDVYIWCPERIFPPRPPQVSVSTIKIKSDSEAEDEVTCGPIKSPSDSTEETIDGRVVGGSEASLGEFPWMVALLSKGKQVCGGTLLDETHVLTAAHCVSHLRQRHLSSLKVLIGDHDLKDPTDIEHQERNVSAIIYHKAFTVRTIHSDVAIIVLSEPVQYADNVAPICLSNGDPPFDEGEESGTLTGWGQTGEDEPLSRKLLQSDLPIWKQDDCVESYKGKGPVGVGVTKDMLCAGSTSPDVTKDACKGDSGGPLSIVKENRTEQIGIVSWGIGCGVYPGVFTRVPSFLQWIEKHRSQQYFVK